jgi:hypothetical protein
METAHASPAGPHPTRGLRRFRIVAVLSICVLPIFQTMAGASGNACVGLTTLALPDATVTSAVDVAAQGSVPAYCRVLATAGTETDIEVRLPEPWGGRLVHLGGSGLDGFIQDLDVRADLLQQGFAVTASNSGHRDPTGGPTRFLNDPVVIEAYAHGAIGQTIAVAKAVVLAYYGEPAGYTYFTGCSAGGRAAFNAAARYGAEYDGVVAGAPTRNMAGMVSAWALATQVSPPSVAKLTSMYEAQLAQCDTLDGLDDGIIGNPAKCRFDLESVRCPSGTDNDSCLTDAEIDAVKTIRSDVKFANGRTVYVGLGIGHPGTGFGAFMPLGGPGSPVVATLVSGWFLPYMVYGDPAYDPRGYDVDTELRTVEHVFDQVHDFSADTNPLAQYLRSGGKVIVWHGAEDALMSHRDTIRSYEEMSRQAGRGSENARLYVPPGVNHCGGGPGADAFDMIGALAEWVEQGQAPGTLTASKFDATGNVLFTRPLCEYPKYPRHDGENDPDDAASFRCVAPGR